MFFNKVPSTKRIWFGTRHKDYQQEVKYFLWMAMHDAHMVGNNWLWDGYSNKMKEQHECKICGVTETMEL